MKQGIKWKGVSSKKKGITLVRNCVFERGKKKRRQQGSNLRGRSPTDFKSVSLTTRTYRLDGLICILRLYISFCV